LQKTLVRKLFERVQGKGFSVQYWDGTTDRFGRGTPRFKLILRDPAVLPRVLKEPELGFGEAYMEGRVEVEGDLRELVRTAIEYRNALGESRKALFALKAAQMLPWRNSPARQKKDVQYHYDIGNEFYSLWLDETMSYSCAYFKSPNDSLHQAQLQKVDHTLRKLQLKPGHTLLDIGSGWGWLIVRAAQQHGVRALGITLSEQQVAETRKRIADLGLTGQVEAELMDYRTLADSGRTFDRVVSVGMFEHVGRANLPVYMAAVAKMLKPGGLSLLHTITHMTEDPVNPWIEKYIFPGGYIPSLRETIWLLPEYDFHVLDVESLRLHYAMTLERWAENYDRNYTRVVEQFGERFARMWRLYLHSCAASFRVSGLDIHQILFSKGLNNDLPLTRQHLYD